VKGGLLFTARAARKNAGSKSHTALGRPPPPHWAAGGNGAVAGGVFAPASLLPLPPCLTQEGAAGGIGAVAGGILFATGWLLFIDGVAFANDEFGYSTSGALWIPGVLQTLALLMVNAVSWGSMSEGGFDDSLANKVKAWVFVSFVFAFSGLIATTYITIREANSPSAVGAIGPATRGLLQNILIFLGSLAFRAGRLQESE